MSSLKRKFITGFIWSLGGQAGYLIVTLISNIILARLLTPYEFGQIGIVMFFIIIAKVLTESGLSGALIRKTDATEEDFSTVFIFNLAISFFLFILLISFSGTIADFYDNPPLQNILIALASILLINAFQFTQNAKVIRDLKFKKRSIYMFISVVLSSAFGIILALLKYGVWALVIMQIANAFILTLIYWIFEGPIKKFVFKKSSFKTLYKFGVNTTLASLISTGFENIYNLVLGKFFSIQYTGLYYQAKKLQEVPLSVIKSTLLGVVFSTLSKLQHDQKAFTKFYNRIMVVFTTLVGLICLLIYFYAEQVILLMYGEQWLGAVFFMQILIIASFFLMQEMLNRVLFKVFDKTEKILYLEIIKNVIQLTTVVIGIIKLDLAVLMYGFLATSVISYFINYYYSRKIYQKFSWEEIIKVFKVLLIAVGLVGAINILNNQILNLQGFELFYFLPFLIGLYLAMIYLFNVVDIVTESKIIFKQIRKR